MWFSAVYAHSDKVELPFPFIPHTLFTIFRTRSGRFLKKVRTSRVKAHLSALRLSEIKGFGCVAKKKPKNIGQPRRRASEQRIVCSI
jgi:hypothetical protein